jgi:hypothetical protein
MGTTLQINTIISIKKEQEAKHTKLFEDVQLFFAFNDQQFLEGKPELKEGDKFLSIGGGGYLPKSNFKKLTEGLETIKKWYQNEIKKNKMIDKLIKYEICNYECFYSDLTIIYEMFPDISQDHIKKLYNEVLQTVDI